MECLYLPEGVVTSDIIFDQFNNLRTLDLSLSRFVSDESLVSISSCSQLQVLNLWFCNILTDYGWSELLKSCAQLKTLCMSFSADVTIETAKSIGNNLTKLQKIHVCMLDHDNNWDHLPTDFDENNNIELTLLEACKSLREIGIFCRTYSTAALRERFVDVEFLEQEELITLENLDVGSKRCCQD